jgi:hypothetical protein
VDGKRRQGHQSPECRGLARREQISSKQGHFRQKSDIFERQGASRERERESGIRNQESGDHQRRISGQPGHINCCFRPHICILFSSKLLCRRLALNRSLSFILHSSLNSVYSCIHRSFSYYSCGPWHTGDAHCANQSSDDRTPSVALSTKVQ